MTDAPKIVAGKVVGMHYTLTSDAGEVIDSSRGSEPMPYLHGHGNIVPGLEKALDGHVVGDKITVKVPPAEGYGEKDERGVRAVPRDAFPADAEIEVGMQFGMEAPDGSAIPFWIQQVGDEEIVIDMNHPLAGQNLNFEIEIMSLRDATPEELAHGHAH